MTTEPSDIPPPEDPPTDTEEVEGIELTLVPVLRLLFLRGLFGALLSVAMLMIVGFQRAGATWAEAAFAFKIGLPIGFLLLAPTALAEAWAQRRKRSAWSAGALSFLLVLIGWVLGFLQASYAIDLGTTGDAGASLSKTLNKIPQLLREPLFVSITILWPLPVAVGMVLKLGRLRGRIGWSIATLITLGICLYGIRSPEPNVRAPALIPFALLMLSGLLGGLLIVTDNLYLMIWPPEGEREEGPLPPLTAREWVLYGGPSYAPAGALWVLLGLGFGLASSSWWTAGMFAFGFTVHALISGNLPRILLASRRPERAIAVGKRQLRDRATGSKRGRRHPLTAMIRAYLYLRRYDEADALLPEVLALFQDTTQADQVYRTQIALAYLQAGRPERAYELCDAVPEETFWKAFRPNRTLIMSVALGNLDRVEEALALLETIDPDRSGRLFRMLVRNNRAVYLIDEPGSDPAEVLRLATEAHELAPVSYHKAIRPTLGAAMLFAGKDAAEALDHLRKGDLDDPLLSPQSKAWLLLQLGRAHRALGDEPKARELWTEGAALTPEGRGTRLVRAALAELDPDGEAT